MMATTIISSISVKPCRIRFICGLLGSRIAPATRVAGDAAGTRQAMCHWHKSGCFAGSDEAMQDSRPVPQPIVDQYPREKEKGPSAEGPFLMAGTGVAAEPVTACSLPAAGTREVLRRHGRARPPGAAQETSDLGRNIGNGQGRCAVRFRRY